jgi:NAD(P)-dependent dehydrogenase (short-subunit alcohol dehydrogenase family)
MGTTGTASKWTASDLPRLDGRVAVITGANSGLGLVAARQLARAGADVVLACRDISKGQAALAGFGADQDRGTVESLDLADLQSVRDFAGRIQARHDQLDLLINNAGVMAPPRRLTADGFESQIGTNHLGHFALTGLLLPSLLAAGEGRVVTVSSGVHRIGRIAFDDLQGERRYRRWPAYGQSKLANLLFCFELARRSEDAGAALRSLAAHPGYSATNLQFAGPVGLDAKLMRVSNRLLAQSAEMGALPSSGCARRPAGV